MGGVLDPRQILLATGMLYAAMPLAVGVILWSRHDRRLTLAWCIGSACMGGAAMLFALRGTVADWLSIPLANALAFTSYYLRVPVLRIERGDPARAGLWLAAWAASSAFITIAFVQGLDANLRVGINAGLHTLGTALLAQHAWALARRLDSIGMRLFGLGYGLLCALFVLRGVRWAIGATDSIAISPQLDFVALAAVALLTSLCSNVGYLGMALDRARLRDTVQREALDRLQAQQRAMELAAREREAVRGERHRSSQVLAHEVRQPLHNAAVSLQAASAALAGRADAADAAAAVARAQSVLQRVSASLDNTVAAATLLMDGHKPVRQEVELDMLLGLCVGDLPPEARSRVRIEHAADARSASLAPGLLRLALRNLLINATLYAPPGSPVRLRLLDTDDPLGLAVEVADEGPGLPAELQQALANPQGPRSTLNGTGHGLGLGLGIVRRVAELHGGRLEWQPALPQGSVFRLLLPQGQAQ